MFNKYIIDKANSQKTIKEIKAKLIEACEKCQKSFLNAEEAYEKGDEWKRIRAMKNAEKLQNQAIALGWILGIDKADIVSCCYPEA